MMETSWSIFSYLFHIIFIFISPKFNSRALNTNDFPIQPKPGIISFKAGDIPRVQTNTAFTDDWELQLSSRMLGGTSADVQVPNTWRTLFVTNHADCCLRWGDKYSKFPKKTLKIDISIHTWTPNKMCSIRYTQYVYMIFWTSRKRLYKRRNKSRRSRRRSAADFFGCFGVLNTLISWKSNT